MKSPNPLHLWALFNPDTGEDVETAGTATNAAHACLRLNNFEQLSGRAPSYRIRLNPLSHNVMAIRSLLNFRGYTSAVDFLDEGVSVLDFVKIAKNFDPVDAGGATDGHNN